MVKPILLFLAVALLWPAAVWAEEEKEFNGKFLFGYRLVDTSGSDAKFREDINLESGARLFNFQLSYAPRGEGKKLLDEVSLTAFNLGGDPFESFQVQAVKYGAYTFSYQRLKSDYVYADELWSEPLYFWQMRESTGGDYHTFHFQRVSDRAAAKIWLGKNAHFYFNFDRFRKTGGSTTTVDVFQEEFEVDKPVDQSSKEVTLGLDYTSPLLTASFHEKIRDFKDANSMFLPGYSEGEWYGYPSPNSAAMAFYYLDMPYDSRSYTHSGKVVFKPSKKFLLQGGLHIINLEMDDFAYREDAKGTDRNGKPQAYTYTDKAFDMSRDITLADVNLSYLFCRKLSLVAAFRYGKHKQESRLEIEGGPTAPNPASFAATENLHTTGVDAGLQFQPQSKLTFTVGFRHEKRTIEFEGGRPDEETKRLGLFGNVVYNPLKGLHLTADYQYGDYKDPVLPVAPARQHRLRVTALYKRGSLYANASLWWAKTTNDTALYNPTIPQLSNGWEGRSTTVNLRLGYVSKTLHIGAGWNWIDTRNTANDRRLNGATPYLAWPIYYCGTINLLDFNVRYTLQPRWSFGATVGHYTAPAYYGGYYVYKASNDSATAAQPTFTRDENYKNRDLSRLTLKPFIEYTFSGGLSLQVSYWLVDFKDPFAIHYTASAVQLDRKYKANIFEITFGYRW